MSLKLKDLNVNIIVIKPGSGLTRPRGRVLGFMGKPGSTRVIPEKLKNN